MRAFVSTFGLALFIVSVLAPSAAHAQLGEAPGSPAHGNPPMEIRAVGDVLFDVPVTSSGVPIGLEHDGAGTLLLTHITQSEITVIDTGGVQQSLCVASTGSLQSITTDGMGRTWVTRTDTAAVEELDASCQSISSFSVIAETTFPDSLTYNPTTGNLYVVDADTIGADNVHEYTLAGALVNTFPLATLSTDGIAYDPLTGGYWIYDSGSDSLTQYDASFSLLTSFPGVGAAGFIQGEGVAVLNGVCYVIATGSVRMVAFDCGMDATLFTDGFESGDTSAWSP